MSEAIQIDLEQEEKLIMREYRKLRRKLRPILKEGDSELIKKSFKIALEAHSSMRRKSGEAYIFHPIAVAMITLDEIGLGPTAVAAALMHDVVEDTDWTLEDMERHFGPKVRSIIEGLTKIDGVYTPDMSQQAENFRKMLLTLSDDVRVILIKLADRLHNMRTLGDMPQAKRLKIAAETIYVYAPLAHRLGLYTIKTEMEDLYLKNTEEEKYRAIANQIHESKDNRDAFIKDFMKPIRNELKKTGMSFQIKGRPKSIYSIWRKMEQNKVTFEQIYDLFAIRIIIDADGVDEKAACWRAYSIVTDFYKPNPDRLRDWISTPKSNGYESLHTTVISKSGQYVEVQIRTSRMDEIAEKGYAAHWKYKEKHGDTKQSERGAGLDNWLAKIREMLESSDASALELLEDFKQELYKREVYVFTPQGDLKVLPDQSTVLDFAFEIHSDVGKECLSAKVNQKLVPLSYKLQNGDQIEIITSRKQKPSKDWLKFVVTGKAKSKIKDSLREEERTFIKAGREIVERKFTQLRVPIDDKHLNQLRAYFEAQQPNEVFFKVGKGIIDSTDIKKFRDFREEKKHSPKSLENLNISDGKSFKKTFKDVRTENADMLYIGDDMDRIEYTMAKCCQPIPGDEVFGFVTINEGIRIHRTSCPNAQELLSKYGHRVIKARWNSQKEIAFLAGLRINGADRFGMIKDISAVISNDLRVNMRSIAVDVEDGMFNGELKVFVHDTEHLDWLMQKLKEVQGVLDVVRFSN